jgi:hypothetical protein
MIIQAQAFILHCDPESIVAGRHNGFYKVVRQPVLGSEIKNGFL